VFAFCLSKHAPAVSSASSETSYVKNSVSLWSTVISFMAFGPLVALDLLHFRTLFLIESVKGITDAVYLLAHIMMSAEKAQS
jgi:hypothetical protein